DPEESAQQRSEGARARRNISRDPLAPGEFVAALHAKHGVRRQGASAVGARARASERGRPVWLGRRLRGRRQRRRREVQRAGGTSNDGASATGFAGQVLAAPRAGELQFVSRFGAVHASPWAGFRFVCVLPMGFLSRKFRFSSPWSSSISMQSPAPWDQLDQLIPRLIPLDLAAPIWKLV